MIICKHNRHRFTKHYFIGDKRVASRLGLGEFRNVYGSNGSNVTAGQQDYAERMNQIEQKREEYYKLAGVAPGLPTMKGSYADPEVTGKGYNILIDSLGDHSVPENWVQHPVVNTEAGSNPGAPLAWGSPENPDDVVAGYGYVAADTSEVEETFYYHSDHLGSTAYITDQQANVTQYDAYLPYGELLVDEHSSSADLPYKFNGKELDEETGLYYYGARYMNPIASIWYGVDPLTEKYPNVSAFVYCMGNPVKLIDMDGLSPDSACAAAMAQVSYNENTRDTKRNIAYLKQHHWFKYKNYKNEKNGFKAAVFVYQPDKESGITEWAIAYAGTDDLLDVKEDVKNFLGQTTTQQFDAVGLANKIEEYAQGREITFIGHSLGGDLAITASSWTPHDAIVFNPASTCFLTRLEGRILGRGHGKVTQYRTFGDPLGVFQDMIPTKKAPGKRHYVKGNTHSVQHFNNQFRK